MQLEVDSTLPVGKPRGLQEGVQRKGQEPGEGVKEFELIQRDPLILSL